MVDVCRTTRGTVSYLVHLSYLITFFGKFLFVRMRSSSVCSLIPRQELHVKDSSVRDVYMLKAVDCWFQIVSYKQAQMVNTEAM